MKKSGFFNTLSKFQKRSNQGSMIGTDGDVQIFQSTDKPKTSGNVYGGTRTMIQSSGTLGYGT